MEKTQVYHFIQRVFLRGEHKIAEKKNLIFLQSASISPRSVSTKRDPGLKDVSFLNNSKLPYQVLKEADCLLGFLKGGMYISILMSLQ